MKKTKNMKKSLKILFSPCGEEPQGKGNLLLVFFCFAPWHAFISQARVRAGHLSSLLYAFPFFRAFLDK